MNPRILHETTNDKANVEHLGPYALESLIAEDDEISMTAYRVTIAPRSTTAIGHHKLAEEIYYILEGCGVAILNGVEIKITAGEFLRLPAGTTHGFVTHEDALVMLDIHSPGSRPDRDVYFEGEPPSGFADNAP